MTTSVKILNFGPKAVEVIRKEGENETVLETIYAQQASANTTLWDGSDIIVREVK